MSLGFGMGFTRNEPFAGGPSLSLQFVGVSTLDPSITFTRTGNATYFDSAGVLQTAGTNVPRFDYDPATLASRGLLIEETRVNSIRNNTMVGAVAGTPGTLPTNWTTSGLGTLTQTVVGVGVVNGINYIDLRLNGTTSTTQYGLRLEASNGVAATNGQTWAFSTWSAVVSGSLSNITTLGINSNLYDAGTVYLTSPSFAGISFNTGSTIERRSGSLTIANASAAFIQPQIFLSFSSGVAIDITLRIGLPQLENNNLNTGVSTATVVSGGTTLTYALNDVLTVVGGTGTAATLTVTGVSAGAVTTVSVTTAGSYSVFPTSPVSVTGGGGAGATFNLTPVAQSGFATSVIPTSTVAVTRNADVARITTLTPWFNATEGTLFAMAAVSYGAGTNIDTVVSLDDNTANNRMQIRRVATTQIPSGIVMAAGTATFNSGAAGATALAANAVFRSGLAYATNDTVFSDRGLLSSVDTTVTLPTVTQMQIGNGTATQPLNGWIRRITYYPRRMSSAELQSITT